MIDFLFLGYLTTLFQLHRLYRIELKNDELERLCKEVVVKYFKVLF
jgi:hypothetical protein